MTTIKLRRGLSTAFSTNNPVLAAGEPAFATDTGILKIGDGTTVYNNLPSIGASPDLSNYVQKTDYASTSAAGVVKVDGSTVTIDANGVISAAGSAPSNMVTTDTKQTISGAKTFSLADGTTFQNSKNANGSAKLGVYDTSSFRGGILLENKYQAYHYYPSLTFGYNGYGMTSNAHITMYAHTSYGGPLCIANGTSGVINIGPASPSTSGTYTGLRIKADGTLLEYNNNSVLTSPDINNIVKLTQSAYDALATKDANTFYVIVPS